MYILNYSLFEVIVFSKDQFDIRSCILNRGGMSHCNSTAIAESSALFKVMKIVKVKKIKDHPFSTTFLKK